MEKRPLAVGPPLPDSLPASRRQFVICLAGHIDHGKSAIVQALTGAKVDRLPEEKRRGITIELGFSHFDDNGCRFALIDVPGHERFIHNMVAGASGVDAALLVIAADDSVMPQTREHLALLELLGVRHGVIAISKCDLADEEHMELVELEVAELVEPTFLADAPQIRVSTIKCLGIAELRRALIDAARSSPARAKGDRRFRLPIDRAFSPAGQGAVVTGTVWRGTARVGDTLHLLPEAMPVRIRRLQSQGADVESIVAGERAAINLVGIKASAIHRGDELATPDAFVPARRHLVELRILPDTGHPLKHRQLVRLHLGANQATAQVLMGQREVEPGQTAFAVVRCGTPIVAEYGQPFVLRQLSPATTIGGGRIIGPALRPTDRLKRCLAAAPGLASADAEVRLNAYIDLHREVRLDAASQSWIGLSPAQCEAVVEELIERKEIVRTDGSPRVLVSARRFEQLKQRLLRYCQVELERRRPASQVPLSVILSAMSRHASEPVLQTLLETMTARRELVRRGERVGLATGPELSHRQRNVLNAVLAGIASAGPTPPTLKELAEQHDYPLKDLEPLVQVAVDEGRLIRVSPLLALDRRALEALRRGLADYFEKHATGTVSEIREQWNMTRKHAVPILEFFDQCQVTQRAGDNRSAGPRLSQLVDEVFP
jgi:selenocysteine-specific elongation factor